MAVTVDVSDLSDVRVWTLVNRAWSELQDVCVLHDRLSEGSVLERQPIHEDSVTVDDGALSVSMVMDVSDLAPEEKEKLASVVREQERRLQHLHGGLLSSGE
jgi:hypothetical protein